MFSRLHTVLNVKTVSIFIDDNENCMGELKGKQTE